MYRESFPACMIRLNHIGAAVAMVETAPVTRSTICFDR